VALTDTWLRSNHKKTREKPEERADRDGLSVRVSPKGKIVFQVRFRFRGKAARIDLGAYPGMSLKQAREELHDVKRQLEQGIDPRIAKKEEKLRNQDRQSLSEIFEEWFARERAGKVTSAEQIRRSFEIHVLPTFGSYPPETITLSAWMELLEDLSDARPAITKRLLGNLKRMLKWAVKREKIDRNVLADITAYEDLGIESGTRGRALSDEDLLYFFDAIRGSRIERKNKLFMLLCLFYGCRNGELRKAEKSEFNFEEGYWATTNHKRYKYTKQPLYRPITKGIEPYIRELMLLSKSKFLLVNRGEDTPMSDSAQISIPYNIRQWVRKNTGYEMEHWSTHDLRKTARTYFSAAATDTLADKMIGHAAPGEREKYDFHRYLEESSAVYDKWWEKLYKIMGKKPL